MDDPNEKKLKQKWTRSVAGLRYQFRFFPGGEGAVFPIFEHSGGKAALVGTGFFVAPGGVFATAKHVFVDPNTNVPIDAEFSIFQERDGDVADRDIVDVVPDPERDIAIGILGSDGEHPKFDDHPVVGIMSLDPEKHEVVASFTFSHTLVDQHVVPSADEHSLQEVRYRRHWELGCAEEVYPDGFMYVPGRCFTTSILVEGRGSGGPVFNSNGFVTGINSTGFAPDEQGRRPHSTASSIVEIEPLEIAGLSIRDRRKGLKNQRIAYCTKVEEDKQEMRRNRSLLLTTHARSLASIVSLVVGVALIVALIQWMR